MGHTPRVLVVDDEPVVIEAIQKLLAGRAPVDAACSAEEAIAKAGLHRYGVVVTDLMLPHTSGLGLLSTLRQQQPSALAILMTGYATVQKAVEALMLGAFDFIAKPFEIEELQGVVVRAMRCLELGGHGRRLALENCHLLGKHSWTRLTAAEALLGAGETFLGTMGKLAAVEFPALGTELRQGDVLARITAADGCLHLLRTPLSGIVTGTNTSFSLERSFDHEASLRDWLVSLSPSNLAPELQNLKLCGS